MYGAPGTMGLCGKPHAFSLSQNILKFTPATWRGKPPTAKAFMNPFVQIEGSGESTEVARLWKAMSVLDDPLPGQDWGVLEVNTKDGLGILLKKLLGRLL
jgi:hypothetical protein